MPDRPACRERKKNGRPCRAPALREGSACFWHAAETREAAAEARRLGGLRRRREGTIGGAYALEGFRTGADLQRVLELALADTLELENSVPRTRAPSGGLLGAGGRAAAAVAAASVAAERRTVILLTKQMVGERRRIGGAGGGPVSSSSGVLERETGVEPAALCLGSICSRFADRGPAELGGLPRAA